LVEMLVVVSIMVVLSATIIANLRRGQRTQELNAATESIVSALRQMQNNVLSGLEHGSSHQPAGDFGFEISSDGTLYTTFSELTGQTARINLETVNFTPNIAITNLVVGGVAATMLQVRFLPPFGKVIMTGASYTNEPDITSTFNVRLTSGSAILNKTITIDGLTGRIETQ